MIYCIYVFSCQASSAPTDPNAPTFHPVSSRYSDSEIVGELEPKDVESMCLGGFASETQTYYNFLEDGTFIMVQVIHSSIGCATNELVQWMWTLTVTF